MSTNELASLNYLAEAVCRDCMFGFRSSYHTAGIFHRFESDSIATVFESDLDAVSLGGADQFTLYETGSMNGNWRVRLKCVADSYPNDVARYSRLVQDPSPIVSYRASTLLLLISNEEALSTYDRAGKNKKYIVEALQDFASSWPLQERVSDARTLLNQIETRSGVPLGDYPSFRSKNFESFDEETTANVYNIYRFRLQKEVSSLAYAALESGERALRLSALDVVHLPSDRTEHGRFFDMIRHILSEGSLEEVATVSERLVWWVNEMAMDHLCEEHLALTYHSCRRIVQTATRGLKEYLDTKEPPPAVVGRLFELLNNSDALVRVAALHSLKDLLRPTENIQQKLLNLFESEPETRVQIAAASTLKWWLDDDSWKRIFSVWLAGLDPIRWSGALISEMIIE